MHHLPSLKQDYDVGEEEDDPDLGSHSLVRGIGIPKPNLVFSKFQEERNRNALLWVNKSQILDVVQRYLTKDTTSAKVIVGAEYSAQSMKDLGWSMKQI